MDEALRQQFLDGMARVAASGIVWVMMRLKAAGFSAEPRFQSGLRRRIVVSPGLKLSMI